jgi:hypothetical protein
MPTTKNCAIWTSATWVDEKGQQVTCNHCDRPAFATNLTGIREHFAAGSTNITVCEHADQIPNKFKRSSMSGVMR